MHFNYHHLLRAFEVYEQKYDDLYNRSNNNYDKLRLFSRQIIGFIQRSLPAIDRMVFAQSLYEVAKEKAKIQRSFHFTSDTIDFPATTNDHSSRSGLGFEYFAASWSALMLGWSTVGKGTRWFRSDTVKLLENLWRAKTTDLQNLCRHIEQRSRLGVCC